MSSAGDEEQAVLVECEVLEQVQDLLRAGGPRARPVRSFAGCTSAEIEAVIAAQSLQQLPAVYRCFLARMGKDAGGFLARGDGAEYLYPEVLNFRQLANQILEQNGHPFALEQHHLVIGEYLSQQFHFLNWRTGNIDDPPVWTYLENYVAPVHLAGTN